MTEIIPPPLAEASVRQCRPWLLPSLALSASLATVIAIVLFWPPSIKNSEVVRHSPDQFFSSLPLEAKAVVVFDLTTGQPLFNKNSDDVLPLASVTKLMTILTASTILAPDTEVTIGPEALKQDGDNGLRVGEKWRLEDLIDFTLVTSSNDGAVAIAEAAGPNFIEKMNTLATQLNLTTAHFTNPSGLDLPDGGAGAVASASDVAKLLAYIVKQNPRLVTKTRFNSIEAISASGKAHFGFNTNTEINNVPGLMASKTGFTDLADGNLAIIFDRGLAEPVAIVVLGSSKTGRFSDVEMLAKSTLDYFHEINK